MTDVLIIEPDEASARLYASALEAVGCKTRVCFDTQTALLELDKQPAEVIVLELDIPWHNGFEFLYEFISYDDWVDIPFVVHTSVRLDLLDKMLVKWSELNVAVCLYKADTTLAKLQSAIRGASLAAVK